jgi:hypothetical protein
MTDPGVYSLPIFGWAWKEDASEHWDTGVRDIEPDWDSDLEPIEDTEEVVEWEFDIGDRVIATPDTDAYKFPGTVVRVYEKFGDCDRRYGVRLDAQDTEYFMEPVRKLRFVFGYWQLQLVPPEREVSE